MKRASLILQVLYLLLFCSILQRILNSTAIDPGTIFGVPLVNLRGCIIPAAESAAGIFLALGFGAQLAERLLTACGAGGAGSRTASAICSAGICCGASLLICIQLSRLIPHPENTTLQVKTALVLLLPLLAGISTLLHRLHQKITGVPAALVSAAGLLLAGRLVAGDLAFWYLTAALSTGSALALLVTRPEKPSQIWPVIFYSALLTYSCGFTDLLTRYLPGAHISESSTGPMACGAALLCLAGICAPALRNTRRGQQVWAGLLLLLEVLCYPVCGQQIAGTPEHLCMLVVLLGGLPGFILLLLHGKNVKPAQFRD